MVRPIIQVFCNLQFLSMKLAAVNPEMSFNLEQILTKDVRDRNVQKLETNSP